MSSKQLALDAALLEAALRDGLPSDHPSLRGLSARHPEWLELLAEAGGASDLDPRRLEQLRAEARPEDRRLTDELLAEVTLRSGTPGGRRTARLPRWVLAAAGLLISVGALVWWQTRSDAPSDRGVTLSGEREGPGAQEASALSLPGSLTEGSDFAEFSCTLNRSLSPSERLRFQVFSLDERGSVGERLDQAVLRTSHWATSPERAAGWPDRILLRVILEEEGNQVTAVEHAYERSRP